MRIFICRCRGWTIGARVQWHHGRGEFLKFGYFGGRELSAESPLLFLFAPALRVHPRRMGFCGISRRRSSGRLWGLTSGRERECGLCFGKGLSREMRTHGGDQLRAAETFPSAASWVLRVVGSFRVRFAYALG